MQVIFLPQDDRFYVRLTDETAGRMAAGAFSITVNVPVYAVRIEGEGDSVSTYFYIPGGDGRFYWVPADGVRLARR